MKKFILAIMLCFCLTGGALAFSACKSNSDEGTIIVPSKPEDKPSSDVPKTDPVPEPEVFGEEEIKEWTSRIFSTLLDSGYLKSSDSYTHENLTNGVAISFVSTVKQFTLEDIGYINVIVTQAFPNFEHKLLIEVNKFVIKTSILKQA